MAIVAGIDEAGYGPLLGPLVVTGTAFRVPDDRIHRCLWEALRGSCTRTHESGGRRMAIADSKQLYHGGGSLTLLERAALVMLAVRDQQPRTWRELVSHVAPSAAERLDALPWYRGGDVDLPVSEGVGDVCTRANAVRLHAREQGVEFLGAFTEPVLEADYNALVERTKNKSIVLFSIVLKVLGRLLDSTHERRVRVCVDRLGGRMHYREALQTAFPHCELHILEESPDRSAYRLAGGSRVLRIEFTTGGEELHLPIALASIYSKYLRELYMRVFNEYWSSRMDGLRPTAGYYTDARRWLVEAGPLLEKYGVDRTQLVRSR